MPLGRALPLAEEIAARPRKLEAVDRLELAGSIRRRKETVGDIDILVTSSKPEKVMDAFTRLPQVGEVLARGATKASVRHREGIQIDLRVVEPEAFGAALVYFTGSKQHNIRIREMAVRKGLKISEYGVFDEATARAWRGRTEEDVYRADRAAVDPARAAGGHGRGRGGAQGRAARAGRRVATFAATSTPTRTPPTASRQHRGARRGGARARLRVHRRHRSQPVCHLGARTLARRAARACREDPSGPGAPSGHQRSSRATECDILPDGSMDYPDDVLADLDIVVGAVHSRFEQSKPEMTRRICRRARESAREDPRPPDGTAPRRAGPVRRGPRRGAPGGEATWQGRRDQRVRRGGPT